MATTRERIGEPAEAIADLAAENVAYGLNANRDWHIDA